MGRNDPKRSHKSTGHPLSTAPEQLGLTVPMCQCNLCMGLDPNAQARDPESQMYLDRFDDHRAMTAGPWSNGWVQDRYGEEVAIYIDDTTFDKKERRFIRQLVRDIDEITGTKITKVGQLELADIHVFEVEEYVDDLAIYNGKIRGTAYWDVEADLARVSVVSDHMESRKKNLTAMSQRIITHELMHGLGLSHPNNDGFDKSFDGASTTMSYNNDWSWTEITEMDKAALQSIWGAPAFV